MLPGGSRNVFIFYNYCVLLLERFFTTGSLKTKSKLCFRIHMSAFFILYAIAGRCLFMYNTNGLSVSDGIFISWGIAWFQTRYHACRSLLYTLLYSYTHMHYYTTTIIRFCVGVWFNSCKRCVWTFCQLVCSTV